MMFLEKGTRMMMKIMWTILMIPLKTFKTTIMKSRKKPIKTYFPFLGPFDFPYRRSSGTKPCRYWSFFYFIPQFQMLPLQLLPLPIKFFEVLNRPPHFVGAIGNTLLDQLPEPIPRSLQVNAHAVKPCR